MLTLIRYSVFLGVFLSTFGLGYLAQKEHDSRNPKTLSQLVVQKPGDLTKFRLIIWFGGTFIAITMFRYIVPRISHSLSVALGCAVIYSCELLLSIIPDRGNKETLIHYVFAYGMGVGMLATALLLALNLQGGAAQVEAIITMTMVALSALTFLDHKRFIFYELSFIELSHISIVVAALALR